LWSVGGRAHGKGVPSFAAVVRDKVFLKYQVRNVGVSGAVVKVFPVCAIVAGELITGLIVEALVHCAIED
jgi:hypothetical protein